MFFSFDVTIPANTAAALPQIDQVLLPPGVIQQVDVQFPSGCVGLVHTLCRRGNTQVWPSNPDGDFHSNGMTITWQDEYELDDAPFVLRLVSWNLDDTYAHTITWRFSLRRFPDRRRQSTAELRAAQALRQLEVDL